MNETYSLLSVNVLLKHTGSEKRYEIHITQMFVDKEIHEKSTLYVTQEGLAALARFSTNNRYYIYEVIF